MSPYLKSTIDQSKRAEQFLEARDRLTRACNRLEEAVWPDEKAAAKWDIIKAQAAMDLLTTNGAKP